ncbi:MAG: dihydrofolate reductase [Phycisphaerae bacterium]|nr:dihydrofolate reductase [Phycisphaerae bacterium]
MKTIIIVAMTRNRVIGKDGSVPWREPEDLKHFKRTTTGHAVIMGRKTFESIGKPLPKRRNIVVTHNPSYALPAPRSSIVSSESSIHIVHSLEEALQLCRQRNEEKAFIIGGGQTYEQALPIADEMIITQIERDDVAGDTYFPAWNDSDWSQVAEAGTTALRIITFRRNRA